MAWKTIEKPRAWVVAPNLPVYDESRAAFSWTQARRALDGLPSGHGLNIAYEAVDCHAAGARRGHLALRWIGRRGETRDFTYTDLGAQTNRFANVLKRLGVGPGKRVFLLAGRIPELYISTADPGWVTGTSYGIIAPLTHGITSIVDEADFDAERWYGIVQQQKVMVWYTASGNPGG